MTVKPRYCLICYYDLRNVRTIREKQVTGLQEVIKCPKCKTVINCDSKSGCVRCINCNRLFSDTISFIDHQEKGVCSNSIKQEVEING